MWKCKENRHDVCAMMLQMQWPFATVLMRSNATVTYTHRHREKERARTSEQKKKPNKQFTCPKPGGMRIGDGVPPILDVFIEMSYSICANALNKSCKIVPFIMISNFCLFVVCLHFVVAAAAAFAIVFWPFSHKCDTLSRRATIHQTNARIRVVYLLIASASNEPTEWNSC